MAFLDSANWNYIKRDRTSKAPKIFCILLGCVIFEKMLEENYLLSYD